jgi:calcium/calmodulin-dependent protein kinase kinase 2
VIHRDLKPGNILVDHNGIAKLGDFGASSFISKNDDIMRDTQGTYAFCAPECLSAEQKDGYGGRKADVFALGVTLFAMVFNELPWDNENEIDLIEMIKADPLVFKTNRNISDGLRNLITVMLEKDHEKRASLDELLKNEWINEGYKVGLNEKEASLIVNLTEQELQSKGISVNTMLVARNVAKKLGGQRMRAIEIRKTRDISEPIMPTINNAMK